MAKTRTSRASAILATSNPRPTTLAPTWTRSPGRRSQRRAEGVPGRRLTRKSKQEGDPDPARPASGVRGGGGGDAMARKIG